MGEGFPFFDIIFFAMIAAFLVIRLRGVLGRRTGNEQPRTSIITRPPPADAARDPRRDPPRDARDPARDPTRDPTRDNVIALPDRARADAPAPSSPIAAGIARIKGADPAFDPARFVAGARMAFEMIVSAFATGDRDTLRPLTSNDVFANFDGAIRERERAGHALDSTLVGIKAADIVDAALDGSTVSITVRIVSEQVNVTRDDKGEVVSGATNAVVETTDFWTFSRDARARDPNWLLIATRSTH